MAECGYGKYLIGSSLDIRPYTTHDVTNFDDVDLFGTLRRHVRLRFSLAMGMGLTRLCLAKIRAMAQPNSPDMSPKRTKEVESGTTRILLKN